MSGPLKALVLSGRNLLPAAAAVFALLGPVSAHANLISNGSFKSPVITTIWYEDYGANTGDPNYGGPTIPDWTITTNNVDIVSDLSSTPLAADGNQYLDLVGTGSTGGISQSFNTTLGQTYSLSFDYGNNPWSTSTASALINVLVGGLTTTITHDTSTTSVINWTPFFATFVGTGDPMMLSFVNSVGGNNGGVLLDNISVTATPLPSTWTMLIAGFLGLGFFAYRGSKKNVATLAAA